MRPPFVYMTCALTGRRIISIGYEAMAARIGRYIVPVRRHLYN